MIMVGPCGHGQSVVIVQPQSNFSNPFTILKSYSNLSGTNSKFKRNKEIPNFFYQTDYKKNSFEFERRIISDVLKKFNED